MRLIRNANTALFAGLVVLLCLVELSVVRSSRFPLSADVLSLVITADLTLGIPLLYYLFFARTRHQSAISLLPVFVAGFILAHLILPPTSQLYLKRLESLAILAEGCALLYVVLKVRTIVRHYRRVRQGAAYAADALEESLRQVLGTSRVISILMTELMMSYYVTLGWFQSYKSTNPAHIAFSYHRKSGYGAVIGMFGFLILLETVGLHLVIQHWSPLIAWILTISSIYTLAWVAGHYQAVRLLPIVLGEQSLHIRSGLRWRVDVEWTNIATISRATPVKKRTADYINAAVYGEPKLVLQLREPLTAFGLLGSQRKVTRIGLTVDDEVRFLSEVNRRIDQATVTSAKSSEAKGR